MGSLARVLNTLYMLHTVTEIKDKRPYQHPEEVVAYLDPGI